jgi:hypothetical protein
MRLSFRSLMDSNVNITKFPITTKQHDSIMVVVDKLTKDAHFILVKIVHKAANIVDIYMREIVKLHGVPKTIVSDRDPKFTSNFWKGLFKYLGQILILSQPIIQSHMGKQKG